MEKIIYIGYFEDAQGVGSIQIAADIFGLIEMQRVFLNLSNGLDTFNFADLPLLDGKNRINLVAYADALDVGVKLTDNEAYEWRVTKKKWAEYRHHLILLFENYNYKPIHLNGFSTEKEALKVVFSLDDFKQFNK